MALEAEKCAVSSFSRHSYFLQFQKYVFSTEIQVLPCDGNSKWFTEDQFKCISPELQGTLSKRIEEGLKTKTEMELFQGNGFLIASRFLKSNSKDSILLSKKQLQKVGMKSFTDDASGGDYVNFILFPERMIVTVAKLEQMEDFHNATVCHRDVNTSISEYFQEIEKLTYSEKKRTNTLKRCITGKVGKTIALSEDVEVKERCNKNKRDSEASKKLLQKLDAYRREKPQPLLLNTKTSSARKTRSKFPSQQMSKTIETFFDTSRPTRTKKTRGNLGTSRQSAKRNTNTNLSIIELAENDDGDDVKDSSDDENGGFDNPIEVSEKNVISAENEVSESVNESNRKRKSLSDDEDFSEISYRPSRMCKRPKLSRVSNKRPTSNRSTKSAETKRVLKDSTNQESAVDSNKKEFSIQGLLESKRTKKRQHVRLEEIRCIPECELTETNASIDVDLYGEVPFEKINNIRELTLQQIKDTVRSLEGNLRKIFEGKVPCERHESYKKGGREKDALKWKISFGLFTDKQEECIVSTLVEMFCASHRKYFDYVMKVLTPETIAMIYCKVENVSREEAERIIMDF